MANKLVDPNLARLLICIVVTSQAPEYVIFSNIFQQVVFDDLIVASPRCFPSIRETHTRRWQKSTGKKKPRKVPDRLGSSGAIAGQ